MSNSFALGMVYASKLEEPFGKIIERYKVFNQKLKLLDNLKKQCIDLSNTSQMIRTAISRYEKSDTTDKMDSARFWLDVTEELCVQKFVVEKIQRNTDDAPKPGSVAFIKMQLYDTYAKRLLHDLAGFSLDGLINPNRHDYSGQIPQHMVSVDQVIRLYTPTTPIARDGFDGSLTVTIQGDLFAEANNKRMAVQNIAKQIIVSRLPWTDMSQSFGGLARVVRFITNDPMFKNNEKFKVLNMDRWDEDRPIDLNKIPNEENETRDIFVNLFYGFFVDVELEDLMDYIKVWEARSRQTTNPQERVAFGIVIRLLKTITDLKKPLERDMDTLIANVCNRLMFVPPTLTIKVSVKDNQLSHMEESMIWWFIYVALRKCDPSLLFYPDHVRLMPRTISPGDWTKNYNITFDTGRIYKTYNITVADLQNLINRNAIIVVLKEPLVIKICRYKIRGTFMKDTEHRVGPSS